MFWQFRLLALGCIDFNIFGGTRCVLAVSLIGPGLHLGFNIFSTSCRHSIPVDGNGCMSHQHVSLLIRTSCVCARKRNRTAMM